MKNKILTLSIILISPFLIKGQPMNLVLSSPETGIQDHIASKSITFASGYSYSPAGGYLTAKIGLLPLEPVSYNNTDIVDPRSRELNTSLLVGSTNGSINVNPMGAATYTIPIDLPSGVNGLNPGIALVYSSMGGPGIAGYGWQLTGLSAITRAPQTVFQDGQTLGVNLDMNDKFALDGQRLVCTSGTYGSDNSQYRTENDILSLVTAEGTSGNGPEKFKAETKSGLIYEYGYTEDAVQSFPGIATVSSWYVSSVSDRFGNKINYSYLDRDGYVYPYMIEYGMYKVIFYYKERTDVTNAYLKGVKLQQKLLLDKVDVSYNNLVSKTYTLKYNYLTNKYYGLSALNEVKEYGIGGSSLNSTAFFYQQSGNAVFDDASSHSSVVISNNSKLFPGDFNGDGYEDLITLQNSPNNVAWVLFNDKQGGFNYIHQITTPFAFSDFIVCDLNGDNKDDLIGVEDNRGGYVTYYWSISDGNGIAMAHPFSTLFQGYEHENIENRISDFDGDGLGDFLIIDKPNNSWEIYSFTESTINTEFQLKASGSISSWGNQVNIADFNGDGKSDIWVFDSNGLRIYSLTGASLTLIYNSFYITSNHKFQLGDFNGDGKTDLFVYGFSTYDYSPWKTLISNGTSLEECLFPQGKSNLKDDKVFARDFNGDGRTDILALSKNPSNNPRQYYFIANLNGNNFSGEYKEQSCFNKDNLNTVLGDYDGNGKNDLLATTDATHYWTSNTTGTTEMLLKYAGDGFGQVTEIDYNKLTDNNIYTRGDNDNFPVTTYQGPLTVATGLLYNNGITRSVHYKYEGLKLHRQGKGFLCYKNTTATDDVSGITVKNDYGYDPFWYSPKLTSITKSSGSNNMSVITNGYAYKSFNQTIGNKRFFPYIHTSTEQNVLTGQSVASSFDYDDYGNLTSAIKNFGNRTETTVNDYSGNINTTDWLLGRIGTSTTTYTKSGEPSVNQSVRYTYSNDGIIKPDYIYYYEGSPLEYFKNHDYDSKGNLTQVSTYGATIGSSNINYTYDTNSGKLLTSTDVLGHVTTNAYDTYGRLSTETDWLNNVITRQYDEIHRQSSVSNSIGSETTTHINYTWIGANKPSLAVYGINKTGDDGSSSTIWYDKIGQAIRSEKNGFDGSMILTDTDYYPTGQVHEASVPYFAGGSQIWAESYTYDIYGRPSTINRNTGRNTSYTYDGPSVNETTAGKNSSKSYNTDGTLSSATDVGGVISYAYYADGKVKNITAPGGIVTSMEYADAARNQTRLTDPSAGTIDYTYNSFGQLTTQTDNQNRLTTHSYRPDGRPDITTSPEGTTSYVYNTTNKQLTGINSPNNISNRTYDYDTQGRIRNIVSSGFPTTFTYDSKGRLSTRTHPSGIVETINYNNGYMSSIAADGVIKYTVTGMNARQQLTAATYGTGLNASFGFDTGTGYPTYTQTGTVQDYGYSFDAGTGNLSSRQNNLRSLSESFSYTDNLDRLTGVTGPQNLSMTFDPNGNLKTKSDIGTTDFEYGTNAGPYALTGVTSSSGVIPTVTQTATYNSFQKVNTLDENNYSALFNYYEDQERAKMDITYYGTSILSRSYPSPNYMEETVSGATTKYTYLGGDAYSAPVVAVTTGSGTTYYYLLRDYQGSITHVYNSSNSTVQEYSYDAWGRRRNHTDWSCNMSGEYELFAGRGFTGHEHLPDFNLINMNGRLYDPLVGRMLSVDNFVQVPDYSQSFNRYSYCMNNPLRYTDPSGNSWFSNFFKWMGNGFDNLGDWANKNHISIGVGLNYGGNGFTPYAYSGYNGVNFSAGYNVQSDNWGIGNNYTGFSNFWYPGRSYIPIEQIVGNAIIKARTNNYNIEIDRFAESSNSTISSFTAFGKIPLRIINGYFLEREGPGSTILDSHKRIPAGIYEMNWTYSKHFKRSMYEITNSTLNRGIRMHSGYNWMHTQGCIMPGSDYEYSDNNYVILHSRDKYIELMNILGTNKVTLIVNDIP